MAAGRSRGKALQVGLALWAGGTLAACAHLTPPPAEAPATLPPLPSVEIPYQEHRLSNGLRVILHQDRKAPLVAVNMWYHVGSKDERPGLTGFAHLFEHLMFRGTQHFDDDPFKLLEPIGATRLNGTTWYDRTNYFQNVPTGALDRALWVEAERMGFVLPVLTQDKLDEEVGVVLNEKKQGENRPYGGIWDILAKRTWPEGHPYSWTAIGSEADLRAATLDDVRTWFETHYGAANATLVIAGDIEFDDALARVERYFGDLPAGPARDRFEAWTAPREVATRHRVQDRVPQVRQIKVWNVPGYCDADHTQLELAAQVFASGKNTPLYDRLVFTEQRATSASAGLLPTEIASQFLIDVMVHTDADPAATEAATLESLQAFLRDGPDAAALERARTQIFAGAVRGLERIDGYRGKAQALAQAAVYCDDPGFVKTWLDRVREATPESVRDAARRWLSAGDFTLTVEPFDPQPAATSDLDRSVIPEVGEADALSLPTLEHFALSNGIQVALAQRDSAPLVQVTLLARAGQAADHRHSPGTARLAMNWMSEGAGTLDALALAAESDRLGASISTGNAEDVSYVSLNALSSRQAESLALMADVVRRPRFDDDDFARLKRQTLSALAQESADPVSVASRSWAPLLFGSDHPYGSEGSSLGTVDAVTALTPDDARAFHSAWIRPDNARLLVVGDTDRATLQPLLEASFGDWQPPATALNPLEIPALPPPNAPRVTLIDQPGAPQTVLVVAALAPPLDAPQARALDVANSVLGGTFSARLNQRLRVEKSWSYGASSRLNSTLGPRAWVASTSVQADKSAEALAELIQLIDEPDGARPFTDSELDYAAGNLTRSLPGRNETLGEVANALMLPLLHGLDEGYWNDYVPAILEVDAAAATAAFAELGLPRQAVYVIVGDLSQIEGPVRKVLQDKGLQP
jgi:zinc protease